MKNKMKNKMYQENVHKIKDLKNKNQYANIKNNHFLNLKRN